MIPADHRIPLELTLERGQTLNGLLSGLGLEGAVVFSAVNALREHVDPRELKIGQNLTAFVESDESVNSLELRLGNRGRVSLERRGVDWASSWNEFVRTVETAGVGGSVEGSLAQSLVDAGGPSNLAYKMADVLQWDLDFSRDLRLGDRFEVLYEKVYLDGAYTGVGRVLALSYSGFGGLHEAFLFGEGDQYYDGFGRPLQKMFLRSPLKFSRVTSRFSHRRFHPVLKRYRPHYGVDYGAPVGTPVRVTASGTVTFSGWDRGGGKTVKVRHPNGYVSAYLHLSKYASGLRSGRRVKQGEVIGFVGSTGLSTGPHLDYRVQKNGRWINPLEIKSVPAPPIADDLMESFYVWRDQARGELRGLPQLSAEDEVRLAGWWASPRPSPAALSQ